MTHIKTYLEYKFYQLKKSCWKHYEYPEFITWIFIIIGSVLLYLQVIAMSIIAYIFALIYWIYCDYKTGADIGWKRKERVKHATR